MRNLINNKFFTIFFIPFLLGALAVLSFPPYNFTFINFFSFSILLFLILETKKKAFLRYREKNNKKLFFYLGCSFGFGFFLLGNYWITISLTHDNSFSKLIPFALILIPLFLSLFFGIAILIVGSYAEMNIFFILLFSLIFSVSEFLRGNIMTGFPWNIFSYSWSWSTEISQVLSLIGTYAFSLISITLFCIPFLFFQKKYVKKNIIFLLFFLILFIGNYLYGHFKIEKSNYNYNKNITIKIISPNFLLSDYATKSEYSQLKRLIKISDPEKKQKTVFIWPEGIFYETLLQDIEKYQSLFKEKFSANHLIILGINNFNEKKYFNSLVLLNHNLKVISIYNKINLVPFGEFLPFENFLSKLGLKKITHGYNSFTAGESRKLITLNNVFEKKLILPLICYEIIYPGKIKSKDQFPDLAINISEDAWFGQSIGPYQHFSKAIFRSIEEGIFIARSANKGISAFINPNGEVLKSLNMGESGSIELNFPYFNRATLFSKYGNKIFVLIIFLYTFLILIFRKFKI